MDIVIQRVTGMVQSKRAWIDQHGPESGHKNKRPDWEVALYQQDEKVLQWLLDRLIDGKKRE